MRSALPVPAATASTNFQPRVNQKRSMHTSLHEASYLPHDFFTVVDDGYDASKYGYRVFVPIKDHIRYSSTMTKLSSGEDYYADYNPSHDMIDPRNVNILSSPDVLEILESQREWDSCLRKESDLAIDDGYLSDFEEMQDTWENCTFEAEPTVDAFETPSLDEKKM
jgi:hypothetical protein